MAWGRNNWEKHLHQEPQKQQQQAMQRQLVQQQMQQMAVNNKYGGMTPAQIIQYTGVTSANYVPVNGTITGQQPVTNKLDKNKKTRRENPERIRWTDLEIGDVIVVKDDPKVVWKVEGSSSDVYDKYWDMVNLSGENRQFEVNSGMIENAGWKFAPKAWKEPVKVSFDSVILPEEKKTAIFDAIGQVDNNDLIFEEWGFGDILEKGKAISLLFYGPPGTGKTLMGQAIADHLGRKLKVVGTAEVESSEPGGAERATKAFFEAAEKDDLVLLFDECDSLIGDRRAIGMILGAQVNALLSCLENYTGVVIFTTNRLEKLDEAFDRRLSLKLEFEMPDKKHRVKIWQRMFPKQAPVEDIEWETLAEVPIAGGHIKNVVLRAARRAAASKERKITNDILWEALVSEVESLEKFQDAVSSSTLPKLLGGGMGVRRTSTINKVIGG